MTAKDAAANGRGHPTQQAGNRFVCARVTLGAGAGAEAGAVDTARILQALAPTVSPLRHVMPSVAAECARLRKEAQESVARRLRARIMRPLAHVFEGPVIHGLVLALIFMQFGGELKHVIVIDWVLFLVADNAFFVSTCIPLLHGTLPPPLNGQRKNIYPELA